MSWRRSLACAGKYAVSSTEINTLPVLNYSGKIKMIDLSKSPADEEVEIRDLLGISKGEKRFIGFDTESKPKASFSKKRNRTALIQLASENACVLYRVVGQTALPASLCSILRDEQVVKVGQGIELDARDLKEDFPSVSLNACIDLFKVATHLQCQPKSLQGLVGMFLKNRLLKDMRISDWEAEVLRAEQVQYAAIDAWAARAVFLRMIEDNIDAESIGRVVEAAASSAVKNTFVTPVAVVSVPKATFKSAQTELVDHCVQKGYLLKLCGFDKVSTNKFKCKFEVTLVKDKKILTAESLAGHVSIREAQEDAARVMLGLLSGSSSSS